MMFRAQDTNPLQTLKYISTCYPQSPFTTEEKLPKLVVLVCYSIFQHVGFGGGLWGEVSSFF